MLQNALRRATTSHVLDHAALIRHPAFVLNDFRYGRARPIDRRPLAAQQQRRQSGVGVFGWAVDERNHVGPLRAGIQPNRTVASATSP